MDISTDEELQDEAEELAKAEGLVLIRDPKSVTGYKGVNINKDKGVIRYRIISNKIFVS